MVFIKKFHLSLGIGGLAVLCLFLGRKLPSTVLATTTVSGLVGSWIILRLVGGQKHPIAPKLYKKTYQFKQLEPHEIGALHLNISQGYSFIPFLHFVLQYWQYIDYKNYGHRFLALLGMSVLNSVLSTIEYAVHGWGIYKQEYNKETIFVLGHPRSGTTMVHNLLAANEEEFIYPSTFFCGFPNGCVLLEPFKHLFKNSIDDKRPMDNMPLSLDTPQEDELALTVLAGGCSPYSSLVFMECEREFRQYFTFDETRRLESRIRLEYKFNEWKQSMKYFMRKVFYARDKSAKKHLVLKSPVHTGRMKILSEMFPNAKFVYIHREPYRVFQSSCNMAEKTFVHSVLQHPSNERMLDYTLAQYRVLFQEYVDAKQHVKPENLIEVSYDELVQDTPGTFEKIYSKFGLKNFEAMKPFYKEYEENSKSFKRNSLKELDQEMKEVVYQEWKDAFQYFGYEK